MKKLGIPAVSAAAVIVGARVVFAAFGPVLPPDFERKYEAGYDATYRLATWHTRQHARYFALHDRWPRTLEELFDLPEYAEWREEHPEAVRRWIEDLRSEIDLMEGPQGARTIRYMSTPARLGTNAPLRAADAPRVRCDVTLDAEYARALGARIAEVRGDWSESPPEGLALWPRMDCRRVTGVRSAFAWAGLDRYRRPPPERYARLDYAARAFEAPGIRPPR